MISRNELYNTIYSMVVRTKFILRGNLYILILKYIYFLIIRTNNCWFPVNSGGIHNLTP